MKYILKTDSIYKKYGSFISLKGLSMNIPKKAIYGFVGKNGAGKTTLIRIICGLQLPTRGDFQLLGVNNKSSEIDEARKHIGAIIESPALYMNMNAVDNLKQRCRTIGISQDKIPEMLELVGLANTSNKEVRNFSLGMRQRLGIAMALCGNPEFLILDEPLNGLDPQGIIEIRNLIIKLNQEYGITILISSHLLEELAKIATHYGFIDNGRLIKEMSAEELENYFQYYIRLKVDNIDILKKYLNAHNIRYSVAENEFVNIYNKIDFSEFTVKLYNMGCKIKSISECSDTIEKFFMELIKGNNNDKSAE